MFNTLIWSLKLEILSYLTINEVYLLGSCSKSNFLIFLREIQARKHQNNDLKKRFLGSGWKRDSISLASYPRCGNSFLRKLLENWSGVITGADSHPCRTLSKSLLQCGFKGEGITDSSVWMIKTHYPERHGYKIYGIDRAILVIRNPFDAIQSYFHMAMTNTHNKSLTLEAFHSLSHIWQPFILHEIQIYTKFYQWWFQRSVQSQTQSQCQNQKENEKNLSADEKSDSSEDHWPHIPVLLIRYEDLLLNQQNTMTEVTQFLLSGSPPLGLHFPSIESINQNTSTGYTPRLKETFPGSSLQTLYSSETIQQMIECSREVLELAGYQIVPESSDQLNNETLSSSSSTPKTSNFVLQLTEPTFPRYSSNCQSSSSTPPLSKTQVALNNVTDKLFMNKSFCVRSSNDPYGRGITFLRKSLTNDDTTPFDIVK